jgi:putative endonuclease
MYRRDKTPCTYIMASDRNGTLYIGVTSNLIARVYQHKNNTFSWFTSEHGVIYLVYFEIHETMDQAIIREKQIKKWNRDWKIRLIEEKNPQWEDLFSDLF